MKPSNFILPGRLKYREGIATIPEAAGHRMIIQITSDKGSYEKEFNKLITKRWPQVESEFKKWFRSKNNFKLGEIQVINVQSDTAIVNMLCEKSSKKALPLCYDSLESCLEKIGELAVYQNSSIHAPKLGKDYKKMNWEKIESLLIQEIIKRGINVTIYNKD